ncbi:IclR family transcriptional regulator [Egibacter rhizosphaerae]|uniref:IclR family transcriptional regulator n=1 Tax=Egibacter rhizosphaerae TaxID=1670831 RepID=A0A411YEC3_9ACTN|nr:IclR family transcriptional regulator [Egibacter rhizosphaerae]QBI19472.1 IclR family transcriptional regulator [Egibacter rhizosphaerae]
MANETSEREAKSAVRTIQILERLTEPDGPTLAELARDLGAPKSSIHAVVQTLIRRGWVDRDGAGRLSIGGRALLVGTAYLDADPVVALARPVLDELVAELDETVHLGRLDGTDIVYLAKRESTQQLRMFSAVGRRLPAYATALGKALLAQLPEDRLEAHLPERLEALTEATLTDRGELRDQLAQIRAQGWSADEGENSEGIACLAVAVPLHDPPQDALSCSVPTVRFGPERREAVRQRLLRARDELAHTRALA